MNMPVAVIVDDSEGDRYLARRALSRAGIDRILEFHHGGSFCEFLQDGETFLDSCGPHPPPTLVLLDINTPVKTGFEVLDFMQELEQQSKIDISTRFKIVILSSSSYGPDLEQAERNPLVTGFLSKPVSKAVIADLLLNS